MRKRTCVAGARRSVGSSGASRDKRPSSRGRGVATSVASGSPSVAGLYMSQRPQSPPSCRPQSAGHSERTCCSRTYSRLGEALIPGL